MARGREYGTPFAASSTASGNTTTTVSAIAGKTLYVTDFSGSSDLAGATIQVKDGSTVVWQDRVSNTCPGIYQLSEPLSIAGALTVVVTGTSYAAANVAGYSL